MPRAYDQKLIELEALHRKILLSALEDCAKGRWGLFGHNDAAVVHKNLRERPRLSQLDELLSLGADIAALRTKLGLNPYDLHEKLIQMRSSHDANTRGGPKLAREWLELLLA